MRHFEALLSVSRRLHLPERFATDLMVHDRRFCAWRDERAPFLWLLYRDGTHVVRPCLPTERPPTAAELSRLVHGLEARCWFGWDGVHLQVLADDAAAAAFLEQHRELP